MWPAEEKIMSKREDDLTREIQDHLELEAEDRLANGLGPEDAARAAHAALEMRC